LAPRTGPEHEDADGNDEQRGRAPLVRHDDAGYTVKLGHPIAASTGWQIRHDAGIDPLPRRAGPAGKQFPAAQAHSILAADVALVDTVLRRRSYALIVIEHRTRRGHLAGITAHPDGTGDNPGGP